MPETPNVRVDMRMDTTAVDAAALALRIALAPPADAIQEHDAEEAAHYRETVAGWVITAKRHYGMPPTLWERIRREVHPITERPSEVA